MSPQFALGFIYSWNAGSGSRPSAAAVREGRAFELEEGRLEVEEQRLMRFAERMADCAATG